MNISGAQLDKMRLIGDPMADSTMLEVMKDGNPKTGKSIFTELTQISKIQGNTHPKITEFIQSNSSLSSGVDHKKLRAGQNVFAEHGPSIFIVLFCKSLPQAYACAKGAEVLLQTGRLVINSPTYLTYSRRLMETAQFVVNVLWEGGFSPEGNALDSIHKTRLIHASIRYYLQKKDWDTKTLGIPINQEDKAGTLLSFSTSILLGLQTLVIDLSRAEQEGYFYLWMQVGKLLGIDESLIPSNIEEGIFLKDLILKRQVAPSEAGKVLTSSAVKFMNFIIPGNLFDHFPAYLMNKLVSEDIAKATSLEVQNGFAERMAFKATQFFGKGQDYMEDHFSLVRFLTRKFERQLLEGIFHYFNESKQILFQVPDSLKTSWQKNK